MKEIETLKNKTLQNKEEKRKEDRRKSEIKFSRRKLNRREKEFIFHKTVYLTDTNMMGNTYFAQYFDWQGEAREEFFRFLLPDHNSFLRTGIKLITLEAHNKYFYESVLFDEILIKLSLGTVTQTSVVLNFSFYNLKDNTLLAKGAQKIAFASKDGKYIPVPEELINSAKVFIN